VSTAEASNNRIFIRMSKFLMRVIMKTTKLETLLLGNNVDICSALPARAPASARGRVPARGTLTFENIFQTCRDYKGDLQEVVQLVSLLVTHLAWLLIHKEQPPPTLATMRPGAIVIGCRSRAEQEIVAFAAAAAAVNAAPLNLSHLHDAEARHKVALEHAAKLMSQSNRLGDPNTAAIVCRRNFYGVDVWARFPPTYIGQSKGTDEPDNSRQVTAFDAKIWVKKMLNVARDREWLSGTTTAPLAGTRKKRTTGKLGRTVSSDDLLGLELLVARPVHDDVVHELDAFLQAETHDDDETECVLVISKQQLMSALGPIFGGIAARCTDDGDGD